MSLFQITDQTVKGKAIKELQDILQFGVTGGAAVTGLVCTGITLRDTIETVTMFTAGVPSDVTSEASITAADEIELSTTDSTGNVLLVRWRVKPPS